MPGRLLKGLDLAWGRSDGEHEKLANVSCTKGDAPLSGRRARHRYGSEALQHPDVVAHFTERCFPAALLDLAARLARREACPVGQEPKKADPERVGGCLCQTAVDFWDLECVHGFISCSRPRVFDREITMKPN